MKPVVLPAKVFLLQKRRIAIHRAQYICSDLKKSKEECKVAWDEVDDLTKAIYKVKENQDVDDDQRRIERSQRIYDC
jgi:hypothetical protein